MIDFADDVVIFITLQTIHEEIKPLEAIHEETKPLEAIHEDT